MIVSVHLEVSVKKTKQNKKLLGISKVNNKKRTTAGSSVALCGKVRVQAARRDLEYRLDKNIPCVSANGHFSIWGLTVGQPLLFQSPC